jgi:DNA-binding CsgD family transcriptional regulator
MDLAAATYSSREPHRARRDEAGRGFGPASAARLVPGGAPDDWPSLSAILEALSSSAFVVRSDALVLLANSRGRAELDEGSLDVRRCLDGRDDSGHVSVHPLPAGADGMGRALVLHDDPALGAALRIARGVERWQLTPQQTAVLRLLVHGESNKTIATQRKCALRTVEAHVTALLRRSRTSSRAELVARFWTLA